MATPSQTTQRAPDFGNYRPNRRQKADGIERGYYKSRTGERIAYRRIPGDGPGIFYLHGLAGSMMGRKSQALEEYARARGQAYVAIDLSGHGKSSGEFQKQRVSQWRRQVAEGLDRLTEGPQVLVGSSLGGWMAGMAAVDRPEKVAGMVTLAGAPDGVQRSMLERYTEEQKAWLDYDGYIDEVISPTKSYRLERGFFEDGLTHNILDKPRPFDVPARVIHGDADDVVPLELGRDFAKYLGPQAVLDVLPGEDHGLKTPEALAHMTGAITEISAKAGFTPKAPQAVTDEASVTPLRRSANDPGPAAALAHAYRSRRP